MICSTHVLLCSMLPPNNCWVILFPSTYPQPLRQWCDWIHQDLSQSWVGNINKSSKNPLKKKRNKKKITVLTGAGVSAESGIPTFRGAGGLWRTWSAMELATPEAFAANPSLVWEFYHYRRCVVANSTPNIGHYALAMLQQQCKNEGKHFTIITQNIDGLHWKAGSKDVVELHGSLWKTQCCRCDDVQDNYEKAVCPALDGKGAPDPHTKDAQIPVAELPHCRKCNGLLRPHVVWFGECLDPTVLDQAENALIKCDLLLVVGTSAVVQPAAGFAPFVQGGGGVVAEFNIEDTPISRSCRFKFHGPSAKTLPQALGISPEDLAKHKSEESN